MEMDRVEVSLSVIQWHAVADAFLTYIHRKVHDLYSFFSDCEMLLPSLLLSDSLIIPALLAWVDSRHFDVQAREITVCFLFLSTF